MWKMCIIEFEKHDLDMILHIIWCHVVKCHTIEIYFGNIEDKTQMDYIDRIKYTHAKKTLSASKVKNNSNKL